MKRTCNGCMKGKMHRLLFPRFDKHVNARDVLGFLHSDVVRPLPWSIGGSRLFVTFIDDCSRFCFVYPIKNKSDVFGMFKGWLAFVENQHGVQVEESFIWFKASIVACMHTLLTMDSIRVHQKERSMC